jgi:hypothetical protein
MKLTESKLRQIIKEEIQLLKEALTPKDKKVIEAFYYKKSLSGKLLTTDGKLLEKMGMGGMDMAHWEGHDIVITAKSDVASTDSILRYMKKFIPKNNFSSKTPISNYI